MLNVKARSKHLQEYTDDKPSSQKMKSIRISRTGNEWMDWPGGTQGNHSCYCHHVSGNKSLCFLQIDSQVLSGS